MTYRFTHSYTCTKSSPWPIIHDSPYSVLRSGPIRGNVSSSKSGKGFTNISRVKVWIFLWNLNFFHVYIFDIKFCNPIFYFTPFNFFVLINYIYFNSSRGSDLFLSSSTESHANRSVQVKETLVCIVRRWRVSVGMGRRGQYTSSGSSICGPGPYKVDLWPNPVVQDITPKIKTLCGLHRGEESSRERKRIQEDDKNGTPSPPLPSS